ncbi:MAG: integrase core domain-containing protein [Hydrogenophaga sp.]|nr:integrase core domain-containing protein [Hydrogenophaga sp.]
MPEVTGDKEPKKKFKTYPIGSVHIDIAEVHTAEGMLYLYVAIDRTGKFAFVQLVTKTDRTSASAFLVALIAAVPYKIHTVLADNGIQFTFPPQYADGPTATYMTHMFHMCCHENGIEHRLIKIRHLWTNGHVERMNRTIREATVKRYHDDSQDQLAAHLHDVVDAYYYCRRLKTLRSLTPYEYICKISATEPEWFKLKQHHQMLGPNTLALPSRPGVRGSLDFVSDALTDGRRFRVLAVVDDFTRECLCLIADTSLSGARLARELDSLIAQRGKPKAIVSDNGTEMTSMAILKWCQKTKVRMALHCPGKPMQNGSVESFNGGFRDKCLNETLFSSLTQTHAAIIAQKEDYNRNRPYSSLGNITPSEVRNQDGYGKTGRMRPDYKPKTLPKTAGI